MVVVGLMGGLGNQLFQYACGRMLAAHLGVGLRLDTRLLSDRSPRENFTYRDFELDAFRICAKKASSLRENLYVPNLWMASSSKQKRLKSFRKLWRYHLYQESREFTFQPEIMSLKDNTYIYGYFQSELYFRPIRSTLLEELTLSTPLSEMNASMSKQMRAGNSVSLHIRRGDYVNSSFFHELNLKNYYLEAIRMMMEKLTNPHFYVFSDDPEFAEKELSSLDIEKEIISVSPPNPAYVDLHLMSCCKHQIIANSSYSWWGAWLNENPEKIVIAPKQWFAESSGIQTTDLIPEDWICI